MRVEIDWTLTRNPNPIRTGPGSDLITVLIFSLSIFDDKNNYLVPLLKHSVDPDPSVQSCWYLCSSIAWI